MDFVVVTASFIKYIKKVISLWERFESTRSCQLCQFCCKRQFYCVCARYWTNGSWQVDDLCTCWGEPACCLIKCLLKIWKLLLLGHCSLIKNKTETYETSSLYKNTKVHNVSHRFFCLLLTEIVKYLLIVNLQTFYSRANPSYFYIWNTKSLYFWKYFLIKMTVNFQLPNDLQDESWDLKVFKKNRTFNVWINNQIKTNDVLG